MFSRMTRIVHMVALYTVSFIWTSVHEELKQCQVTILSSGNA